MITGRGPPSALTPTSVFLQQRPDCRSILLLGLLYRKSIQDSPLGVKLTARSPRVPPEPGELMLATFVFKDGNVCLNRGSLIEVDTAKLTGAHV